MTVLPVLTAPDPRLKMLSLPVDEVTSEIKKLIEDMVETMYAEDGCGLAAPQIGVLKQIIIVDPLERKLENDTNTYPLKMINPQILSASEESCSYKEYCLSLPEQGAEVERPNAVTVKYIDYDGNDQVIIADGFLARIIQHEMDHLKGKLLIDYLGPVKRDVAIRKLAKMKIR